MNPLRRAETTLLRMRGHLATREQDLFIAQKAGRETDAILKEILVTRRNVSLAEKHIARLKLDGGR
jgi:hypothetical protein